MKRIVMILAAMAAVLSSCSKNEIETVSVNDGKDIVLNISVSDPAGADTKAIVKTAWANGDSISIWYDENTQVNPDLVITYNGTKWIQKKDAAVSGNNPLTGSGKYAKALYNGNVKVASKDDYTYADNTLTFNIANWVFLTEIQVVVYGDDLVGTKPGSYLLSCDKFTPCTGYSVGTSSITATTGTAGTAVTGMSNGGVDSKPGVAFVFASCTNYGSSAEYKFSLTDGTESGSSASAPLKPEFVDLGLSVLWATHNIGASKPEEYGYYFFWGGTQGYVYGSVKGYSTTKTFSKDASKIKALKIASSKLSEPRSCWVNAENGEELKDGFSWKNTPFNNGSSNYNSTYFSNVLSDVCPSNNLLAQKYDAAYKYLGEGYLIPTKDNFQELINNTTHTWVTNYHGTGVNGMVFTSKKEGYTDISLFFPASGDGEGDKFDKRSDKEGFYQTRTLNSSNRDQAYNLFLKDPLSSEFNYGGRRVGRSVRPVKSIATE